jgi:fatty acid desaturase
MTFGRDERDVPEGRRRRPRWLTFLTVLMLLVGGGMLHSSVTDLHQLISGKPAVLYLDGGFDPLIEAQLRGQVVLANALSRYRPTTLAVHAAARLALGLVLLFAVAAIFSSDARGRRAAVLAAWASLVVYVGNALFLMLVVGRMLPWLLPTLVDAITQDSARVGREAMAADAVALQARILLVDFPLMGTGIGMVFGLLLLLYFRGRRMRLFYNQPKQGDHG